MTSFSTNFLTIEITDCQEKKNLSNPVLNFEGGNNFLGKKTREKNLSNRKGQKNLKKNMLSWILPKTERWHNYRASQQYVDKFGPNSAIFKSTYFKK